MKDIFTVYFGGSLFNHKDLTGNALLAEYIEKCSDKKYQCCLPQNVEQHDTTAREIRNEVIIKLIECDEKRLKILYQWALTFPGGGLDQLLSDTSLVNRILPQKMKKGLA